MTDLVLLPATEPDDHSYGRMPHLSGDEMVRYWPLHFPRMVWYNEAVRHQVVEQIAALKLDCIVLVGFSKSGLGAWHLAQMLPQQVRGTIIFDAPVAREELPPWGTAPFYHDDTVWQRDLPMTTVERFAQATAPEHQLVLLSGASFHDEMATLALACENHGVTHTFLPEPTRPHRWDSGWLEQGIAALCL